MQFENDTEYTSSNKLKGDAPSIPKRSLRQSVSVNPFFTRSQNEDKMFSKQNSLSTLQSPTTPPSRLAYSLSKDFINLTTLSNELGASSSTLCSKSSRPTSFSGISHVINSLLKSSSVNRLPHGTKDEIFKATDLIAPFIESLVQHFKRSEKILP